MLSAYRNAYLVYLAKLMKGWLDMLYIVYASLWNAMLIYPPTKDNFTNLQKPILHWILFVCRTLQALFDIYSVSNHS